MKKTTQFYAHILVAVWLQRHAKETSTTNAKGATDYLSFPENARRPQFTGGITMILFTTDKNTFKVFGTKTVGNTQPKKCFYYTVDRNDGMKIYECARWLFPKKVLKYIYYDQLGSYTVTNQNDLKFVENSPFFVERSWNKFEKALDLDHTNF